MDQPSPASTAPRVRRARTPWGRADVEVDAVGLRLRPRSSWLDADTAPALLVLGALVLGVAGAYLPDPFGWVLWVPAVVALVVALAVWVVTWVLVAVGLVVGAGNLLSRRGRRRLRQGFEDVGTRWRQARDGIPVPAADLVAPPVVDGGRLLATLVLPLRPGPMELTAWSWQVDDLHRVAAAMDALARRR